jgi:hypothetical protein
MKYSPLKRLMGICMGLAALVMPASATWSIVVVNRITGEVGIACATCLANFNLEQGVPVIVVGKGAAAAQSFLDITGNNRLFMFNALKNANADPQSILDSLAISDMGHQTRQYGILSLAGGGPVTFSGTGAGAAAIGVTGQVGDYVYAIQGNVLTSDEVIFAAEAAFVATDGDMGQRLMAAMQGARALGGDGRCSCSTNAPTSCGAPPPGFTKSAHSGFLIVARMGNRDGICNARRGCSTGIYHININIKGSDASTTSIDPVIEMQRRYDGIRRNRVGSPDGVNFDLQGVDSIPADGLTQRFFTVHLADIDGTPLSGGGALVSVRHKDSSTAIASIGPVVDNADGSYTFSVTAGTSVGTDQLIINADDGVTRPDLYPYLSLRSEAVPALHLGFDSLSAMGGDASLPLQFNLPNVNNDPHDGRYVLMASLNGTSPGIHAGLGLLPLNQPIVFLQAGHPSRQRGDGIISALDDLGRAAEDIDLSAGVLLNLIGRRIDFAALYTYGGGLQPTNSVGVQILP